jgi:hypothetical protein
MYFTPGRRLLAEDGEHSRPAAGHAREQRVAPP